MYWYNLTELLPPVYSDIKSMFAAADSENTELLAIMALLRRIKDNFFIQTCDVQTLEYWENLIGITLYGDETIESRRQMVLLYLANNWQITKPFVEQCMLELFGEGHYAFGYDPNNHLIVRVLIEDATTNAIHRFLDWFVRVCPAHIQWLYGHIENTRATNYISCGTTSHETVTTSCTMTTGTGTLYLGGNSYTVPWIEVS